ncbi:cell wall metabolism sensor histidine kinase WalK [Paenibacillus sp. J2TS4]|uniref:sensor histidine kinase n=1 Tax=Paenibacillus sp. J2TS4 TaxID=2807194 RepID=UPI001B1ADB27|nr:HAMP domain-containing sensor histidine kinase [Paenibacillus sp. J2TS4]GIP31813.1 two-component sensor histidine kinase [Paenibacillus sp. J2TS4]
MKVSRKIFLAMASFIVAMSGVFILVTHLVVQKSAEVAVAATRGEEIESLAEPLGRYYQNHGHSWEGVQQLDFNEWSQARNASFLLLSTQNNVLLRGGDETDLLIKRLGITKPVRLNGQTIAVLYYYDPEVAYLSKMRIGIPISVLFLLILSASLFIAISLGVAYWLSKRLTAPLYRLIPAIDRLGKGEFGIQAPVSTKDEYGKVAQAFNDMSRMIQNSENVRRSLVADVAHELRTPITIIRGKLDLAQQSGKPMEQESLLSLQDELIRLTRLVDDLHLLSLAESRKLPMERKATSLPTLLNRIVDHVTPDTDRKSIRIFLTCDSEVPEIDIDPNRMTQVFLNLIVNAIHYTPQGGSITIGIDRETSEGSTSGYLRITVTDTGPGIEPEHLPHLFDRFYRTDEARARFNGGMGLGLAIAKGFVTAHDGSIDVESTLGKGTHFIVRLPM